MVLSPQVTLRSAVQTSFEQLRHLVGNTPMLEFFYTDRGEPRSLYVKCEQYNLTGSMKDRMALHVLYRAYCKGQIQPGDRIVEATSGSRPDARAPRHDSHACRGEPGTGGTVMGVGCYLRSHNPAIRIHPLEPAESPTLSVGYKAGTHRIQGFLMSLSPVFYK